MDDGLWRALVCLLFIGALLPAAWAQEQSRSTPSSVTNSLPPTNFADNEHADRVLPRPAPGLAGTHVATHPLAPAAQPVGARTCLAYHRLEADHFTHTLHALGLHVANRSSPAIPVCEACHRPGSVHTADPQAKGLIIGYTRNSGTPVAVQTAKHGLDTHAMSLGS